jgi:HSP20 family protein
MHFDPFAELSRLQDEFFARPTRREVRPPSFRPAVDIHESKDAIVVKAELPGVKVEDVSIHVENHVLTLTGERKLEQTKDDDGWHRVESSYGSFTRSFQLPNTVNTEAIDATMNDGVLTLKLPKRAEVQPRRIAVKSGGKLVQPQAQT